MKTSALAAAFLLSAGLPARAQEGPREPAVTPVPSPPAPETASARTRAAPRLARGLDLGPYGRPYAASPLTDLPAETPRFRTEVEVHGKARDAAALTARLHWWLADADLTRGATPATMSAPSLDEMREYRPHPPDAVDLVPVMRWLTEAIRNRRR